RAGPRCGDRGGGRRRARSALDEPGGQAAGFHHHVAVPLREQQGPARRTRVGPRHRVAPRATGRRRLAGKARGMGDGRVPESARAQVADAVPDPHGAVLSQQPALARRGTRRAVRHPTRRACEGAGGDHDLALRHRSRTLLVGTRNRCRGRPVRHPGDAAAHPRSREVPLGAGGGRGRRVRPRRERCRRRGSMARTGLPFRSRTIAGRNRRTHPTCGGRIMTATDTDATQRIRERIREAMPAARDDLARLVAFRSVADPRQFPVEECVGAANWVRDAFTEAGIESVETIETADASLAVLGHTPAPDGAPTVLLYSHYDVQPPGDESLWRSEPFTLTERDGRWYGRGAADCKGNVVMHLLALRALCADGPLPVGVRIVIEGSEEMGGAGLDHLVAERPELFDADLIVIGDSGNAEVGRPTLTTTLRGIANVDVHIETLKGEIHSGMYGGAAPDALAALIHLLGTLRDERGNTVVDGLDCTATWDGVPY